MTTDATGAAGAAVSYAVTATDPDDGTSSVKVACSPASGSTFAAGADGASRTTTVTCHAQDRAGNQSPPMSFTVTVLGFHAQAEALAARVRAAGLRAKEQSSLLASLDAAEHDVARGERTAALARLGAFVGAVGRLPAAVPRGTRSAWIASAGRLIAILG